MATTIKLKNGSGAPTSGDLVQGEPALDLTNKRLYTEDSGGTVIEVGTNPTSVTTGDITATGTATFAGLTTTANVSFGDNDKIQMGAGPDLEIYHDGASTNFISSATSNLEIKVNGGGNFKVGDEFGNHLFIVNDNGDVQLKHGSTPALKLATTSTGIDVTGTVTADGLKVNTSPNTDFVFLEYEGTSTADQRLRLVTGDDASTNSKVFGIEHTYQSNFNNASVNFFRGGSTSGGFLTFDTNGTEAMRINGSGNVGIGTSVPAHKLSVFEDSNGNRTEIGIDNTDQRLVLGAYFESGVAQYATIQSTNNAETTAQNLVLQPDGGNVGIGVSPTNKLDVYHAGFVAAQIASNSTSETQLRFATNTAARISNQANTALLFDTNGTERMRLDASGNLLVGRTSTLNNGQASIKGASGKQVLTLQTTTDANSLIQGFNAAGTLAFQATGGGDVYASGNLLVGGTISGIPSIGVVLYKDSTRGILKAATTLSTADAVAAFYNTNGKVGQIITNGSSTAYQTSSDQRLKENIVDAPSASDDIDAIQVRSFDWKADGSHQKYGMVAQELNTVAPEAVSTPEDPEEMMGVDYSKLVPMLVKEIQSLRARVAQLEGVN